VCESCQPCQPCEPCFRCHFSKVDTVDVDDVDDVDETEVGGVAGVGGVGGREQKSPCERRWTPGENPNVTRLTRLTRLRVIRVEHEQFGHASSVFGTLVTWWMNIWTCQVYHTKLLSNCIKLASWHRLMRRRFRKGMICRYLFHICRLQNDTWWYPCHDCHPRRVFCSGLWPALQIQRQASKYWHWALSRVSWVSHVMMSCQCHMTVSCTGCDSVAALHFQHDHDCHWRNVQWIPRDIIETYRNYFKIRSPPQRLTKRHNAFKHLFQHH
jgi:hypothetical protein